jgi:hypothetical protein
MTMSTVADAAHIAPSSILSWKAPARVVGKVRMMMGARPSSICGKRVCRMPQRTAVGQSGPPQRMLTLPSVSPRCSSR